MSAASCEGSAITDDHKRLPIEIEFDAYFFVCILSSDHWPLHEMCIAFITCNNTQSSVPSVGQVFKECVCVCLNYSTHSALNLFSSTRKRKVYQLKFFTIQDWTQLKHNGHWKEINHSFRCGTNLHFCPQCMCATRQAIGTRTIGTRTQSSALTAAAAQVKRTPEGLKCQGRCSKSAVPLGSMLNADRPLFLHSSTSLFKPLCHTHFEEGQSFCWPYNFITGAKFVCDSVAQSDRHRMALKKCSLKQPFTSVSSVDFEMQLLIFAYL